MPDVTRPLTLTLLETPLALVRLDADAEVPAWATAGPFSSVTRTEEELSIVCAESRVPDGFAREPGFRALRLEGPFPLDEVGILASVASPLAAAGVAIFVLATFDTDYVLVKADGVGAASRALEAAGHRVARAAGPS